MSGFLGRAAELEALEQWWQGGGSSIAAIWGRRRAGKTTLASRFGQDKPTLFHSGARRGDTGELALLAERAAAMLGDHDPGEQAFPTWEAALNQLAAAGGDRQTLLVLDDVIDLTSQGGGLLPALAAFEHQRQDQTGLRVLLVDRHVRDGEALQRQGAPLHGLAEPTIYLDHFTPAEAGQVLTRLTPPERAQVYGIVGGTPMYLQWWDQERDLAENLADLVCRPDAPLLTEGDLLLGADLDDTGFNDRVLHALAEGRTSYNDVRRWSGTEPARPLERLIEQRLIDRVQPVGENKQARRRRYRITDPFVRFHLGVVTKHRVDIDRGETGGLPQRMAQAAAEMMPAVWAQVCELHLRRLSASGRLPIGGRAGVVGPWWDNTGRAEIDGLVLDEDTSSPLLAASYDWDMTVSAQDAVALLKTKVERRLGAYPQALRYAVCTKESTADLPYDALGYTADDVFGVA